MASYPVEAALLEAVFSDAEGWEEYARELFEAFAVVVPPGKLRFLQYVKPATRAWWQARADTGAMVLDKATS